ncbi:MAG TPA: hypothetical protein VIK01_26505 [Polyangiaceae bacterium]
MSELALGALTGDSFQAAPALDGSRLTLRFSGSGDMNAISPLSLYLKQVHEEALRLSVSEVSCDLQQLVFMNSSCFKSFVVWIDTVKNAEPGYKIRFLTDPNLHWQRRSLEALRRLAANVVTIETATAP